MQLLAVAKPPNVASRGRRQTGVDVDGAPDYRTTTATHPANQAPWISSDDSEATSTAASSRLNTQQKQQQQQLNKNGGQQKVRQPQRLVFRIFHLVFYGMEALEATGAPEGLPPPVYSNIFA